MNRRKAKRVAIALEVEWGYKRHLETYAGCQRYADEAGWECSITPTTPRLLRMQNGKPPFDGKTFTGWEGNEKIFRWVAAS